MVAGVLSGAPSTLPALVTGRSPLDAVRAAGNLVLPGAPQVADHVAFGVLAAAVLNRCRRG